MALATTDQYSAWATMAGLTATPAGLSAALDYASQEVRRVCGRVFTYAPTDGGADEARTFTGNGTPTLVIDDLLSATSVTLQGGDLAPFGITTGGYLLEGLGRAPYLHIVRLQPTGFYDAQYLNEQAALVRAPGIWPEGYTVTITGQWGYAASVPADVIEATCMLAAVRLLGAGSWTDADDETIRVLDVSIQKRRSAANPLAQKRLQAYALLKPYARVDKEPAL